VKEDANVKQYVRVTLDKISIQVGQSGPSSESMSSEIWWKA